MDDEEVVEAINDGSIADSDLVSRDAWRTIRQARARNFSQVDAEA